MSTFAGHRHRPKIGPSRSPATDAMLDYGELSRIALGPGQDLIAHWQAAGLNPPDIGAIRRYRLERVRSQLRQNGCAGALLYDPVNIRYVTDTTNMSIWTMHNPVRYCFVPTAGPVVLFEFSNGEFLDAHSENVDEIRPAIGFSYMYVGSRSKEIADTWADEITALVDEYGNGETRLAVDTIELEGVEALRSRGIDLVAGMWMMEEARLVKSADEIDAMRCAAHACMAAIDDMRSVFEPGITEMALWAKLQEGNFRRHGEWIETRILASGPRTNPWYQEASSRMIEPGDLMGFDTDMVGAYGMCIDMSRTWICGDRAPNPEQTSAHSLAREQIERNLELFVPGTSYRTITENAWYPSMDDYNGYTVIAHGAGMCDEFPSIFQREKWNAVGNDGELVPGMVMCVEAFVGPKSGGEGVKLEEQILITETGRELLTPYSMELS